ncbi:MAG: DNA-binding protein WhiA [Eubacteriales bacterium]
MSYSAKLKQSLMAIQNKNPCCEQAFMAGLRLGAPESKCENDFRCFLRGVFITSGTICNPEKQYYVAFSGAGAGLAESALAKSKIPFLRGTRKSKPIVYIRDSEAIGDFLAAVGAVREALGLMEISVLKSMKRDANRKNNADFANLDKSATASAQSREAIREIMRHKDFTKLPEELRETARLRLENPSLTLDELRALHQKPISKSGLYHRLKKISELSLKYVNNK